MILQRMIFPQNRSLETADLYYKSTKAIQIQSKYAAQLPPGCCLNLFSYFNSFSAYRWNAYTDIHKLDVYLTVRGHGSVQLIHQTQSSEQCIHAQTFSCDIDQPIVFHMDPVSNEGFYYLKIESSETSSVMIKEGSFSTERTSTYPVHIAIATCTFRREPYIKANMERIRQDILENTESPLKDHLNIYVIDNGQTLPSELFPDRQITLIPNANTGGSGGFTRGLIEILHDAETHPYTHALLMDDDIELDTESLERTYSFIRCLKEKYQEATIGGAMLRNDAPCILEESGANWEGKLISFGRGLDLSTSNALFQYDALPNAEYQAWWYCCIPLSRISLDNLPLPFFIHDDDIEYGLRNNKTVLQLNGVCVWHNTFENKRPSTLEYYDVRNHLILNSIHDGRISLLGQLLGQFKRSTAMILRMRYDDVLLNIRGMDDFLKGPKWWANQNITELHQQIVSAGYQYLPLPANVPFERHYMDTSAPISRLQRLKCFLTLNGALFPKDTQPVIIECGSNPFVLYRKKAAYLWDPAVNKAISVRFSLKKMIQMYGLLTLAFIRLIARYPIVKQQYKKAVPLIGTEHFWKKAHAA